MKKFLLILLSIFFISCGIKNSNDNEHIFYLDNPTNKNIEITLDSKLYKLKQKTYEILNLKMGEHIAELSDGTKVYFKIFANSKGGIINPTGATYTIDNSIRYQSPRVCVDWAEPESTILSTIDDFIIDKNYIDWEYDIFEEATYESMSKKLSSNVDIYVFTKIYSPSEFKDVNYDIEKLKIEKEQKESLRKEKLIAIKEINNVAGQFERYISLIRSNIESSIKMNVNDFHLQYLERDKKIVEIQTLASMYFPDLLENVRKLFGVHSRYWGNQNILLRIDVKEDFEGYKSMLKPIIELGEEAFAITKEIRDQLSKKAEALREV